VNTATVSGLDPAANPVTDSASATVNADQVASLAFTKTASPDGIVGVGDVVTYTMTATNDGTVTVTNTHVTDTMAGLSPLDCTPAQGADLAPGASMTCTATYTVTQADVDRGTIVNTASVEGDGAHGAVTGAGRAAVATAGGADLDLAKSLADSTTGTATWLLTVTNHGTGAAAGPITVTDPLPDGLGFVSAAGDGWACTGDRTVTCTHADALAAGAATTFRLVTDVTGPGRITNVASLDVQGRVVEADATFDPAEPGGFAFTGADALRVGGFGALLVLAGWFSVVATRRRKEEQGLDA
jgi:uncharacterized repeat protein (TIGR01451 family)